MDDETRKKVEETVLDILKTADMSESTEYQIRTAAADRLAIDLSHPDRKKFVRTVVETFLLSQAQEAAPIEEEEVKDEVREREVDDDGDLIICHLSSKRRVTLQEFKGRRLVSIREFYEKDGKQLPSSKGISLTAEQWTAFKNAAPKIEAAIEKLR